jgi:pimeloyl-ACP methyl ester carboxylesterase
VAFLLRDKYNSVANLKNFTHPICIIVGTEDPVVPMRLGLDLYHHLSGPKKLIVKEGYGHGDWPNYSGLAWWDDALNFIAPPPQPAPNLK